MFTKFVMVNFLISFALLCIGFYMAWQLSAATNFFYSSWYEAIDIDETIAIYAPKNKNRKGFEQTSKQERVMLFAGIVSAIQNKGEGLRQLYYGNPENKETKTLLTDAEVIHLQDVANLVNSFKYLFILGCFFTALAFALRFALKVEFASLKNYLIGGLGFIFFIVVFVLIAGATKVFYAAHEFVFPDNHQWFFYYEDSLMSTMMKAPVLFGPIALQLLIITLMFWIMLLLSIKKIESKLSNQIWK